MPWGLRCCYRSGQIHYITFSYRRLQQLGDPRLRDLMGEMPGADPQAFNSGCVGVIMPEHVHLLISEPEKDQHRSVRLLDNPFSQRPSRRPGIPTACII
jgi:REP element-mobilizing transposase RayT